MTEPDVDYDFTPNPAAYEYARNSARQRAAYQWEDESRWNLWSDWETRTFNTNWFDPWFEYEMAVPLNNDQTEPKWQMLHNLYYAYCWFKLIGYNIYSICGMMTSAIQESKISGGIWEGGHRPYRTLGNTEDTTAFDPTYSELPGPAGIGAHYRGMWSFGGTYPYYSTYSSIKWTARFTDYSGHIWSKTAEDGTWEAVKRYAIKTSRQMIDGVGMRVMPVNSVINGQVDYNAILAFDYDNPGYTGNGTGYGFCQWTPFTKLPNTLAYGYTDYHFEDFNEANRHWQMNGTLQLMMWELERYISMHEHPQSGPDYRGQWIDDNPGLGTHDNPNPMGAYFIWPYYPNNLDNTANWHFYGQSCTWDQYASGAWIPRARSLIEALPQYTDMQEEDREWCMRQMALAIYRSAFLQAYYADFHFQQRSYYIMDAIKYWDNHPLPNMTTGWDIRDIPRPRDLPYCALDQYHLTVQKYAIMSKRRKLKNVRTILL